MANLDELDEVPKEWEIVEATGDGSEGNDIIELDE